MDQELLLSPKVEAQAKFKRTQQGVGFDKQQPRFVVEPLQREIEERNVLEVSPKKEATCKMRVCSRIGMALLHSPQCFRVIVLLPHCVILLICSLCMCVSLCLMCD